jgi:hypothetical protein
MKEIKLGCGKAELKYMAIRLYLLKVFFKAE